MDISDIFVIGGGINGTAIAADAASRGLSVILCEKQDLSEGTSSASSKLIHGGLRYLEYFKLSLVRRALIEREILMKRAPHLIQPLEFILPYEGTIRSTFIIRIGLFLYNHLTKYHYLPRAKKIVLTDCNGLVDNFKKGFSYYDCMTDDARLVILNALSAKENKALILTKTEFISAKKENNLWKIHTKDLATGNRHYHFAKVLINVAGPWVTKVNQSISSHTLFDIELIKGSHFLVPKLYEGNFAYILQNKDGRIVFAIPYQGKFTLIGTTDIIYKDILENVKINEEEIFYLCDLINYYFKKSIHKTDIQWSYSGVRCLQASTMKNPAKISRDYQFLLENKDCPLLTVIGGKLTTHRVLAEEAVNQLKFFFKNMPSSQTQNTPLPGGNIENLKEFKQNFKQEFHFLPESIAERYVNAYGTRAYLVLNQAKSLQDLGIYFGAELYQKEVEYLIQHEWAKTVDDILWRRTKLGLFLQDEEKERLQKWLVDVVRIC